MLLPVARTDTLAARLNPVTKIVVLVVVSLPLMVSIDVVTCGVLVVAELLGLLVLGVRGRVWFAALPATIGLGAIWFANWLIGGSVDGVLQVTVRLVALGLPGMLLVATTDPVDLADALVQRWHAPARFAYGVLAAFRMLPLLADELFTLRRARRARGVDAGGNPILAVRLGLGLVFALLVQAIRRAVRLAAAMDARGFGVTEPRGVARPSTSGPADRMVIAAAVVLTVIAVAASIIAGQWRFLFS